jgi:hypothetical protein
MAKKIDTKNAKCQEAIRLKYEGETHEAISKKIKTPVDTIKGWFRSEGPLRDEYDTYTLMGSPDDSVKLRATKEIHDRVHGSPKETVEHRGLFGTDLSYEQILRKSREKPPPDG